MTIGMCGDSLKWDRGGDEEKYQPYLCAQLWGIYK